MRDIKTIAEFGRIYRRKDFAHTSPVDGVREIFLKDKAFDHLRDFVTENLDKSVEVEKSFSYAKSKGCEVIKVGNYVGVIETADGTSIEILPKIYKSGSTQTESIETTRKIFLKMLRSLKNTPFAQIKAAHLKATRFPILEVFISTYLDELEKLVQQGLRKNYHRIEENKTVLKGKLLFSQQIRHNMVHKERFYVSYDKFEADIPQNRLIKSTLKYLAGASRIHQNQNRIRQFLFVFDEIPSSKNIDKDFRFSKGSSRLFNIYEQLLEWSSIFLYKQSFTNFAGGHINKAILFPMERIFEDYVAAGFKKFLQDYTVSAQHKAYHLVQEHVGTPKFGLRPDLYVYNDEEQWILDTKWKLIDQNAYRSNYNISQPDMYQLFAYGKKYNNSNKSTKLFLIYPMHPHFNKPLNIFNYEDQLALQVVPFDLSVGLEEGVKGLGLGEKVVGEDN